MIPENDLAVGDRGFASKKLFKEFMDSNRLFLIRVQNNWKVENDEILDVNGREVRVVSFCDLETQTECRLATNAGKEIVDDEEIRETY
ncbi:MAG: hypothetical protein Q6L68_01140 [Thermostichus sp. DG02_5_bins_236]